MAIENVQDVDRGRAWAVLIAVYVAVINLCTILFMNGLYLTLLVEYYNEDLVKTSMIGALNSSLLCLLAPIVSVFMDTYNCRECVIFGGCLLSVSYFVSFFFKSVNVFIVTIGIIGGVGNSFAYIPASVLLAYHFDRWRNVFLSFKEVVVGLGMFLASPVLFWLVDMFGINGSFLIVSGLALQICICGLICVPNSEEKRIWKSKCNEEFAKGNKDCHSTIFFKVKSSALLSLSLCKDVSFFLFLVSTLTWNLILSAVSLHIPRYMVTNGFNEVAVVTVMTIFGLSNTFGRLCGAITVGKGGLDSYVLHTGMLGVLSLSGILFPLYGSSSSAGYIFSGLCGFYTGGPNALMVTLTIGLVGVENLTSAYGLLFFFCGIGILAGPPLLGIVYQATGPYSYCFMTVGFVGLFGVFVGLVAFRGKHSQDQTKDSNLEISVNSDAVITELREENVINGVSKQNTANEEFQENRPFLINRNTDKENTDKDKMI